jgi:hypothetical protein
LTLADKYREEAQEARRMAALSLNEGGKASWLRLADEWNKLAQEADKLRGHRDGKESHAE